MLGSLLKALVSPRKARGKDYIAFVADVAAPVLVTPPNALYSSQPAFRLRTLVAARSVSSQHSVWLVPPALAAIPGGLESLGRPRGLFVSKFMTGRLLGEREVFQGLVGRLVESQLPALADLTDDFRVMPIADVESGDYLRAWQEAIARRCHIAVTCAGLREQLNPIAGRGISVIEDPYECARLSPWREPGADPIRICWFGNTAPAILPPLETALRTVLERFAGKTFAVEFVSAARWDLVRALATRIATPNASFTFTEWSLESTWQALERCDFVLLPQDSSGAWVSGKSHNRLVAAIAAGRLALASPIPAYLELADFAWGDHDLAGGIAWALAEPEAARRRVVLGQADVERRFSPSVVGEKWRSAINALLD